MKILFIHKNAESLGIEYISSVLKKNGHKTDLLFDAGAGDIEFKIKFLDRYNKFEKVLILKIKKFSPDLIAFSGLTNLILWIKKTAKLIKENYDIPIIIGGIHPTIAPLETINYKYFDMICRGEGEIAMLELVNSLESWKENYNIKNIWFKNNNKIIKNKIRPLIKDLDSLPFPDKDLFYKYGAFSIRYYIMTSRGCPYNCTYCFNHQVRQIYKNCKYYVRFRSVDNVINELKWAKKRYKFKKVFFYDDIFGLDINWLQKFCKIYKEEINRPYKCLLHPKTISPKKLTFLKNSNCTEIDVGIESGNEKIRKFVLNRNITNKEILQKILLIKKFGIKVSTLNIIGLPSESLNNLLDTFNLNYIIKPKGALFTILYPFPKTKIFYLCKKYGLINEKISKLIFNGVSGYRSKPLLPLNYEYIIKFNIFGPIFLKLPYKFKKYLFKIPPLTPFRFFSIFFLTTRKNILTKILEFIIMKIRTSEYYKNQIERI
ncbi:MAG: B12-binding domain-containing radical SAM protein [Promethearchaeota archaeon]